MVSTLLRIRAAQRLVSAGTMASRWPSNVPRANGRRVSIDRVCNSFQHDVAPVIEQRQRAECPASGYNRSSRCADSRDRSASALALADYRASRRDGRTTHIGQGPNSVRR